MAKIKSPVEGFTGTTYVGPVILEFADGVADYDGELPEGVKTYLKGMGYGTGNTKAVQPEELKAPADSRELATPTQFGAPLRDAAVDPDEGDFLAPVNAGQADPHGPDVVSPGIHALEDIRPVKGGDVHVDDTAKQDKAESEHAEKATSGKPVTDKKD